LGAALVDPATRETTFIADIASHLVWSSDGSKVLAMVDVTEASEDPARQVYDDLELVDMISGERQRIAIGTGGSFGVAWMPGDESVLIGVTSFGECSVWEVQVSNPEERRRVADVCGVAHLSHDGGSYYAVKHDTSRLADGPPRSNLLRVDVATGESTVLIEDVAMAQVWEAPGE
jgi:hypothetical protein